MVKKVTSPPRNSPDTLEPRLLISNHRSMDDCWGATARLPLGELVIMGVIVGDRGRAPTMGSMSDQVPADASESAIRAIEASSLRQAPVPPVQDDGVRVFTIGTVLFALASLLLLVDGQRLSEAWWLDAAITGVGIGVVGIIYCVWRRNKRARDAEQGIAPPTA